MKLGWDFLIEPNFAELIFREGCQFKNGTNKNDKKICYIVPIERELVENDNNK